MLFQICTAYIQAKESCTPTVEAYSDSMESPRDQCKHHQAEHWRQWESQIRETAHPNHFRTQPGTAQNQSEFFGHTGKLKGLKENAGSYRRPKGATALILLLSCISDQRSCPGQDFAKVATVTRSSRIGRLNAGAQNHTRSIRSPPSTIRQYSRSTSLSVTCT